MSQDDDISTAQLTTGGEVGLATDRVPSETAVVDRTTAHRPARLDAPGTETRRTVVNGVAFVHQRFRGPSSTGPPAALLQHFPTETGEWDPSAPRPRSRERELILIEHLDGAAEADTDRPDLQRLAHQSLDFIDVLGLADVDLLGFSLGVRPPEDVVLLSPRLVERLVSRSHRAR